MLALRRVFAVVLTLAILALASIPASAAERRAFVSPQVALDWNLNAVTAVRASTRPPGRAIFQIEGLIYLSYVQAAVYDAVMKISGRYVLYHSFAANAEGASPDAAVIAAAYRTLVNYLGDVTTGGTTLTAKYNAAIAALPTSGKAEGIAVGEAAASDLIAFRANDGLDGVGTNCPYTPTPFAAGVWQPPASGAQTPWVACMTPFLMRDPAQFRVGPPPDLASAQYAAELSEVQAFGSLNSTVRMADQKATAFFWTTNVINQYNDALRTAAIKHQMDLVDAVRLLAMGEMVTADAGIACMDSKYHYLFWRPVTAIQHADIDGNPATVADPLWTPLLATPNHPEYPSAHGCLTTAFGVMLAKALHTKHIDLEIQGALVGNGPLATTRHFDKVKDMTSQIIDARIWVGFHYRTSVVEGIGLGTDVARWTSHRFFRPARGDDDDEGDDD